MRIVHVVRQYHPSYGGLEDFVRNLVQAQKADGRDVAVVTLDTNFQNNKKLDVADVIDGVPVHRVGYVGSRKYSIAPGVRRYVVDADIVHVHAIDFFVDYLSLLKRLGSLRAKLIVSTHGGIFHTRSGLLLKKAFFNTCTPFSLARATAVIASSYSDKTMFDAIARDVKVIENGVKLRKFGRAPARSDANGFLCLGRFSENKNLLNLVQWFMAAHRRDASLRLYIAGRADTGNYAELAAVVQQLHAQDVVRIVPDPSDEEILALIGKSRFVVSASTYEGFGLTVPELMSYGLIPVLSAIPSFRHFVASAGLGRLFDLNETSFVTAATAAVAEYSFADIDGAEQFALGYSWDRVALQFAAVYDA